mmetsp:Transcript_12576/g.23216  ORF Transcript_12576/g.23216 Transcript_12576/m.23216 type:complete len:290 (+) Transcript_12576:190-1059(+)
MSNMHTASSTYFRAWHSLKRPAIAASCKLTQKLSKIVSSRGCAKTGSVSWQQWPTSRNVRLGQCCRRYVTAASVSFWEVASSSVRRFGEQIFGVSSEDCTKFTAVKDGQFWNICVMAWSVRCGQCISQAMSMPGCAITGDMSPMFSVRSTNRRLGQFWGSSNDATQASVNCLHRVMDKSSRQGSAMLMLARWHLEMYSDRNRAHAAMRLLKSLSDMIATPVRLKLVRHGDLMPGSMCSRVSTIWRLCSRGLAFSSSRTISSVQLRKQSIRKPVSGRLLGHLVAFAEASS